MYMLLYLPVILWRHPQQLAELQVGLAPLRTPEEGHGERRVETERTQHDVAPLRLGDLAEKAVAERAHPDADPERGAGEVPGDDLLDGRQLLLQLLGTAGAVLGAENQAQNGRN